MREGMVFSRLSKVRHPILLILAAGWIVRLLVMPLTVVYDADYWAIVIRNLEVGQDLYGLEGYYYTPIWGYILGLIGAFQSAFLDLGDPVMRLSETFFIEGDDWYYLSSTVPSLGFIYSYKIPLAIFDTIAAYLLYVITKDITKDEGKALTAMALMFLCPLTIGVSCIVGMPDCISVMMLLLSFVLLRKGMPILSGASFAAAGFVKFFPAYAFFLLGAFLILRRKGDKRLMARDAALFVLGAAIVSIVTFGPSILQGDFEKCFRFLTDRTGAGPADGILDAFAGFARILLYFAAAVISVIEAWKMIKSTDSMPSDKRWMRGCLIVFLVCMMYPPAPQYMIVLMPFLAYWIAVEDRRCIIGWILVSIGAVLFFTLTNGSLLLPLAAWTDLLGVDTAISILQAYMVNWGLTPLATHYVLAGVVQYAGIIAITYFVLGDRIREYAGRILHARG